ncbi:MAG: Gfo/Idh/MocA family protein [Anaerolineae bacterium]
MTLRIGIIGAGHMGRTHAKILVQDKRVEVVGIVDIVLQNAIRLADEIGSRAFPSLDALLDEGIDALYVTTPNTQHREPVLKALDAGLHVFSEKPMATTLAEAAEVLNAAKNSKGIYQLGFNYRFAPVHQLAKKMIDGGSLRPFHVHIKDNRGELIDPPWVGNPKLTGGYLYESTIHTLDLIQYLLGEIKTFEVVSRSNLYPELDDFALLFEFCNGSIATLDSCAHASWLYPAGAIEIFGDHATLLTEEMDRVRYTTGLGQEIITYDYSQYPQPYRWGYVEEDRLFIDAVMEGTPSVVPAEDGYRVTELIDALYHCGVRPEKGQETVS